MILEFYFQSIKFRKKIFESCCLIQKTGNYLFYSLAFQGLFNKEIYKSISKHYKFNHTLKYRYLSDKSGSYIVKVN